MTSNARTSSYAEDFTFVFSEIVRIARLDIAERFNLPFPENMAMLPHPSGIGQMQCSSAALYRIRDMAARGIANSIHVGTIGTQAVSRELEEITIQRFFREKRELTPQEADRAVAAAVRAAAKAKKTLTHFIPCHLAKAKEPQEFTLGPVRFRQHQQAIEYLEPKLLEYIQSVEAKYRDGNEISVKHAREYYDSFGWIAEITVPNCAPDISRDRATRIVQSALDCLHMLLSKGYSDHMRAGGPNFDIDKRGHITVDTNGQAGVEMSVDWLSHHLGDGWWKQISTDASQLMEPIGIALEAGHHVCKPAPLAQRFLDSAAWYGEAVRDKFAASRLVKYVTAMERILTTKNEEKLAETLAARGAALLYRPGGPDIETFRQRLRSVYDFRSRLVHGSHSPLDPQFGPQLREAEELARFILQCGLHLFRQLGLDDPNISRQKLDNYYLKLIDWASRRELTPPPASPPKPA